MADNFIAAVKEHMERLAKMQATQPNTEEIVQAAARAVQPFVLAIVKQNNVAVVRIVRDNPSLLRRRS